MGEAEREEAEDLSLVVMAFSFSPEAECFGTMGAACSVRAQGSSVEVHSSVALYLPEPKHKANSPYIIKGLGSRPKVISACSAHLQGLLYGFINLMHRAGVHLCERSGPLNRLVIYLFQCGGGAYKFKLY